MKNGQTPSQTVGPFFAYGLVPEQYGYPLTQVANGTIAGEGQRISVTGQVFDGNNCSPFSTRSSRFGKPEGVRALRNGHGLGPKLHVQFSQNRSDPSSAEAPHVSVIVFMRGLLSHLYTRIYFDDEEEANKS